MSCEVEIRSVKLSMSKCCDKKMLNIKHVSIILLPLLLYTRPARLKAVKGPHEQIKSSPARMPALLLGNQGNHI